MLDEQRPRRVVPRWRASGIAAQTAEAWTTAPRFKADYTGELAEKRRELQNAETVPVASELMFLALQAGNLDSARVAARLILKSEARIGSTRLVATAKKVLDIGDSDQIAAPAEDFVREARKRLALDFRNPILLMDVARELTARGKEKSAMRYVRAAVGLAPQSRFIVRSAARYFLHIGEHEQAHGVLLRSPLLASDPWIQASEIAVATVRGRTSANVKKARRLVEDTAIVGSHFSELMTAVATVELLDGSSKKAKRLFQRALAHPNDNSLAQIEWAAPKLKLVVDEVALRTPLSFEANSNNAYRRLLVHQAIEFAKQWSSDEPFASRPFDALCYLYCLEGQYVEAKRAAEDAIKVDDAPSLSSEMNLMFTRIQNGETEAAHTDLLRLSKHPNAKSHAAHLLANAGALAYVTEDFALGREFYERAIRVARTRNESHTEALAIAYFARAATLNGDETAQAVVNQAAVRVEQLPSPGAIHVVRSLVDQGRSKLLEATASARVGKRQWKWDSATNTLRQLE
jgi:tetratricopeptide (TPR) repeat protein